MVSLKKLPLSSWVMTVPAERRTVNYLTDHTSTISGENTSDESSQRHFHLVQQIWKEQD